MPEEVLRLEGVRKSYGHGTATENEVLHGVDIRLEHGEFVALMGPSGSGKSTLLNVMGLLDRPDGGRIFVEGRDTSALTDAEVTRVRGHAIGFVFQYHYLIPAFTAIENVMMPMLLDRGRPDHAMRESAGTLLDKVGLAAFAGKPVGNLSGGQQQRVAVARALAMGARLILADEPTGNLDTKSADGVFDLMRSVNAASGTTFLIVTHSPRIADGCDRLIELVDGRIVRDAPVRKASAASR